MLSLPSTPSFPAVLTSTSTLQELQPHVNADSPGQGVPGSTLRQLIHWGEGGKCQGGGSGSIDGCLTGTSRSTQHCSLAPWTLLLPGPCSPPGHSQHPPALGEAVGSLTR